MALSLGLGLAVPRGAIAGSGPPVPPSLPVAGAVVDLRTDWYTFEDPARTVPALDDGDKVQGWGAITGANHLSQPTLAAAPTLQTAEAAGKPLVLYDGVDDLLDGGDIAALNVGTGPIAVFVVVRGGQTSAEFGIVTKETWAAGFSGLWIATQGANYAVYTGAGYQVFGPNDGGLHLLGFRRHSAGAFETRLYFDGTLAATFTDDRDWNNTHPFRVGKFSDSFFFSGYVGDVSVIPAILTDPQWASMISFYKSKYGIP